MARWIDSIAYLHYFHKEDTKKQTFTGVGTVAQGSAGRASRAGSEMRGIMLVPSSSPTLSPMYDGLDVNVTSDVTWFHLNHDMLSRRIYSGV